MWLTDRSRYLTGLAECLMKRYLQYHAGPYGYGWRRKAQGIPLLTGTLVHEALATILRGERPGEDRLQLVRRAVLGALENYAATVKAHGLAEASDWTAQEQATLAEGLIWGWVRTSLEPLLEQFEVVGVEREETYVVGCSCGVEAHDRAHLPSCLGVVQMSRPDIVLRRKSDGKLGIHDFKTMSQLTQETVQTYRESVQMAVGTLGVEKRLGEPVEHYYIHALVKGSRRHEYNPETGEYDGPKRESSFLAYLYHQAAAPPLTKDDWQPTFRYQVDGKTRQLGKGYVKEPVWQQSFPAEWPGESAAEQWARHVPVEQLYPLYALIGPYQRQDFLISQYLTSMHPHERTWIANLWVLYEAEQQLGWESEEFQRTLSQLIPRSYNCWSYNHRCEMYDLCFRQAGWRDPVGSGKYVHRRPHHEPELQQMRDRGIPIPEELGEEVMA